MDEWIVYKQQQSKREHKNTIAYGLLTRRLSVHKQTYNDNNAFVVSNEKLRLKNYDFLILHSVNKSLLYIEKPSTEDEDVSIKF
jgi:hypothetical protein